jgi:antitoxin (DNA-binding transcriptional repressor) of toxin-antitoxin stability system
MNKKKQNNRYMKAITVTEMEQNFSDVLFQVKNGEKFKILYENIPNPVAMIIPFESKNITRKIGILDGKAKFVTSGNGKISEEEFLGL